MSSKYKVHPLNTSSGSGKYGQNTASPAVTPRARSNAVTRNNNNAFEEDSLSLLDTDEYALSENGKDFGRSKSGSTKDTASAIGKLRKHHSFSGGIPSASSGSGKNSARLNRTLNEIQANNPAPSFISPRSSANGNRGRARSYNDDDLSVSSLNSNTSRFMNNKAPSSAGGNGHHSNHIQSNTSTKSSLRNSSVGRSRSGSHGNIVRKKKVHFKTPLVEYYDNTVEYSHSEGAENSLEDSDYNKIPGVPRRILRKRGKGDSGDGGVGLQCSCGIM